MVSGAAGATGGRAVIVNADDFGESAEITRGIVECIDAGVLTSTTILANMPATGEALRLAAERGRGASFGVHLNLCEGPSLTAAPSLVDGSRRFHRKRVQALRAFARRLDPADVERELRAQIARVADAGVAISHLDGHKHLHQLPGVGPIVARLAGEFGIERVRCTLERGLGAAAPVASAASRFVRIGLARVFAPVARARGLRFPERTLDLAQLMGLAEEGAQRALLAGPERSLEIFCHPGHATSASPRSAGRERELRYLRTGALTQRVRDAGGRLATFWEL
ncbi:MAG TPA: ChbG/HpnK family deacetylase [Myxococcota bacterium]|jgi:predicted glycoside hydrolase/deacetylase ChbG (UPF0249 family)|nr:ChbG/HpnK family deacetylase [Myxococcota bacterium]